MSKIQIAFSAAEFARVEACRVASGASTLARVVRDALTLAAWVHRQRAEGFVLVAIKGDRVREVLS